MKRSLIAAMLWVAASQPLGSTGNPSNRYTVAQSTPTAGSGTGQLYSHFLNAIVLEKHGQFQKALKEYGAVLELDPAAATVYRQRADLHMRMGSPEKALSDIQAYVRQRPDDAESLSFLSSIHWILGQRNAARLALEKALEKDPYHAESLLTYANMIVNDDPEKAVTVLERYLDLDPESTEAFYSLGLAYNKLGNTEKSQEMFKKVVELDSDSLASLLLLGQMKQKEGDISGAVRHLEQALQAMPDNFALRIQIVQLLALQGNTARIEALLEPFKTRKDSPVEAWLWLGILHEQKKEWTLALDYYLKARKQVNTVELNLRLASLYSQLGKPSAALKSLRELTASYPDNPQFYYFIALAYLDMGKPKRAIPELDKALELNKDFSSAHFQKGVALDVLKNWPEAESSFRAAIHADTTNASACNYIGYTLAERNERLFESRQMIERALELDPFNSAYLDSLGWLNFREGDISAAIRHLKTASDRMPDPVIFDHLGDCYRSTADWNNAALSYSRSLELNPDNREVRRKLDQLHSRLVVTSPARRLIRQYELARSTVADLSGLMILDLEQKPGAAIPYSRGFFYMRTGPFSGGDIVVLATAGATTELRIDFAGGAMEPTVMLRYRSNPVTQWSVFPPEIKDQFPPQTDRILGLVTQLLSGQILRQFDSPETRVTENSHEFVLTAHDSSIAIDKKLAVVTELNMDGYSVKVKKFQSAEHILFPEKIRIQMPVQVKGRQWSAQVQVEFPTISLEKIENNIFGLVKEP